MSEYSNGYNLSPVEARKKPRGNFKHGLYWKHEKLFNLWQTMKTRCENPKRDNYERYGARGITVCEEWHESKNLLNGH